MKTKEELEADLQRAIQMELEWRLVKEELQDALKEIEEQEKKSLKK